MSARGSAESRGAAPETDRVARTVLATNAPLHVVEVSHARPGAETFVLLHGYGASSYLWRHWTEPLAARGRVLLVDLKGFGDAPKPDDGRYGPHDFARAVVDFVVEQDLRAFTFMGQSMGGGVALLASLAILDRNEERVKRMVLVAAAAYRQKLPPFVWLSERPRLASSLLRLVGPRRVVRWAARAVMHDPSTVDDGQVEAYARALETPEGRRAALCAGRQILPPDIDEISKRYSELDAPTLVLWGDSDRVVPLSLGRRLARELPQAELVVIPNCGHVAPEERPEASWAAVQAFLARTA